MNIVDLESYTDTRKPPELLVGEAADIYVGASLFVEEFDGIFAHRLERLPSSRNKDAAYFLLDTFWALVNLRYLSRSSAADQPHLLQILSKIYHLYSQLLYLPTEAGLVGQQLLKTASDQELSAILWPLVLTSRYLVRYDWNVGGSHETDVQDITFERLSLLLILCQKRRVFPRIADFQRVFSTKFCRYFRFCDSISTHFLLSVS